MGDLVLRLRRGRLIVVDQVSLIVRGVNFFPHVNVLTINDVNVFEGTSGIRLREGDAWISEFFNVMLCLKSVDSAIPTFPEMLVPDNLVESFLDHIGVIKAL